MLKVIIRLLVGLFVPFSLVAQCADEWIGQISGLPEGDYQIQREGMAIDPNGNILISGSSKEVTSLIIDSENQLNQYQYPNGGSLYYSVFLTKFNNQGHLMWTKIMESEGNTYDLVVLSDSNGGSYLGGGMRSYLKVDDTIITRPSSPYNGYFLIRFNESGEVSWSMAGAAQFSVMRSSSRWGQDIAVCVPFLESLSIDGQDFEADVSSGPDNQDILIARISEDGDMVSSFLISGKGNIDLRAIDCDDEGCIVQGKFDQELIYGEDTLTTPGPDHFSMYQIAIDNDGAMQWANVSQNPNDMYLYNYGLGITDNGEVHFSGVYDFSAFTLGSQSLPMPDGRDVFVGSLDRQTGEVMWLKKGNGNTTDFTEAHEVDNSESLLGGFFYSTEFEFEGETFTNTNDGQYDGFIVSLDSTGKARCSLSFPGIGQNGVRAVKKTSDGHVLALVSMEQLDFEGQSYTAQGQFDLLLIKTCLPCDTLTSLAEATTVQSILFLYPNPASQSVRVEVSDSKFKVQNVAVTDMLGQAVLNLEPRIGRGRPRTLNFELDIAGLANGVYTVAVQDQAGQLLRQRLVVQH